MNIDPFDLVTVAVLAWMGSRLALSARTAMRQGARARTAVIVRGLRPRHFVAVPFVLAAVITCATVLTSVPLLNLGWWSALGGSGNPVFGVTDSTAGTPLEVIIPAVFLTLLIPAMPLLVEREEQLFRLGAEAWPTTKRAGKAVLFGLVHALIGIPIGVALALSVGGTWFTYRYLAGYRRSGGSRQAALLESTRAHLAYNTTIVALAVVYVVLLALS